MSKQMWDQWIMIMTDMWMDQQHELDKKFLLPSETFIQDMQFKINIFCNIAA